MNLVTFTVLHTPPGGDRARPRTFDVGFPDACNLNSLSSDHREVVEWCLRQWGILGDEDDRDEDDGDGPPGAGRAA